MSCDAPAPSAPLTVGNVLSDGVIQSIDLMLDQLPEPPKRILHVGGTRFRDLAQKLALWFPEADIVLVDPDAEATRAAKEAICCRFGFVTTPLETLPFPDNSIDLTIAHHALALSQHWPATMAELGRVTFGHLLVSTPRPLAWRVSKQLGLLSPEDGLPAAATQASRFDVLSGLRRYGKIAHQATPWPWSLWMLKMHPVRESRLILEPIA